MTDTLTKRLSEATSTREIEDLLHAERESSPVQTVSKPKHDPEPEKTTFTRTEVIGGREFTFEANSEIELEKAIGNAYKVATAVQPVSKVPEPKVDDSAETFAKIELEMQFKRGEISAQDYLAKSGAVRDYLESQGVPLDELRQTLEDKQNKQLEQSWAQATEEFLRSPAGQDWPGGTRNLEVIGLKLQTLGLADAEDKVAALAQAYNSMKSSGMIFDYDAASEAAQPRTESHPVRQTIQGATEHREPSKQTRRASSSMFGMSSGQGDASKGTAVPTEVKLDPNASPQEILEAWKNGLVANHQDVNTAFTDIFSKGRR